MTTSSLPTDLPNASLIKRLMAFMYDLLILLAVSWAYSAVATGVMLALGDGGDTEYLPMQQGHWFELGWLLTIVGFYWFFWMRAGQTVGMRAWRLKVIDASGKPISHRQCFIRMAVAPFSVAIVGLGYLWCLFNKNRASWHDLASGTRTVLTPKPQKK